LAILITKERVSVTTVLVVMEVFVKVVLTGIVVLVRMDTLVDNVIQVSSFNNVYVLQLFSDKKRLIPNSWFSLIPKGIK
jgi:hypothetical protein